ncbi:MAG: DUF3329 domain-containing protein [Alphaproteobacteria bacterium]|nr:DUF3329 domain-containing protein [Alphaproteobacteria bacterium]
MIGGSEHPWFAPLYRRIAVVTVCLLWLVIEAISGEPVWQMISLAAFAYSLWALLIAYRPPQDVDSETGSDTRNLK